jgi:hypothetical protein
MKTEESEVCGGGWKSARIMMMVMMMMRKAVRTRKNNAKQCRNAML